MSHISRLEVLARAINEEFAKATPKNIQTMSKRTFEEMNAGGQATGLPLMTASLLESGLYSDLAIKCQDRVWKVHRAIVCIQSKPLAAALNKESGFKEAVTGIIEMNEHDPQIIEYMLTFMYTGSYMVDLTKFSPNGREPTDEEVSSIMGRELLLHTDVYMLAEEKDVPALKRLASQQYEAALAGGWNSAEFITSLRHIHEGTPKNDRLLWNLAVAFASKNVKDLLKREDFVALCKEKAEIGFEILRAYVELKSRPQPNIHLPPGCPVFGALHRQYINLTGADVPETFFCAACRMTFG